MAFLPITNMGRREANSNGTALTSGVYTAVSVKLSAGQTIKNITFISGTTALATPTHWQFAMHSNVAVPALLGASADQLTAAWAANTPKTLGLATPVVVTKTGFYWFGLVVAAATVPTLLSAPAFTAGLLNTTGLLPGDVDLAVTTGTGLTAAPATIATGGTNALVVPYVAIS